MSFKEFEDCFTMDRMPSEVCKLLFNKQLCIRKEHH